MQQFRWYFSLHAGHPGSTKEHEAATRGDDTEHPACEWCVVAVQPSLMKVKLKTICWIWRSQNNSRLLVATLQCLGPKANQRRKELGWKRQFVEIFELVLRGEIAEFLFWKIWMMQTKHDKTRFEHFGTFHDFSLCRWTLHRSKPAARSVWGPGRMGGSESWTDLVGSCYANGDSLRECSFWTVSPPVSLRAQDYERCHLLNFPGHIGPAKLAEICKNKVPGGYQAEAQQAWP